MLVIALLLALAPTLTSCENHELDDPSIEEDALREYYYTQKFESMFGKIDPQHDWGFGLENTSRMSRAVDVNGNEWVNPPQVTKEEILVVWMYLLQKPNLSKLNPNITRYYLTQVLGSGETYTMGNGTSTNVGSKQMNYLKVAETETAKLEDLTTAETSNAPGWAHVNNFNASSNANYGGNTVMYDSGTWNFAYANSTDNSVHDNYVVAIGAEIERWADDEANWSSIKSYVSSTSPYKDLSVKWTEYNSSTSQTETKSENLATAMASFDWNNVSEKIRSEIVGNYYICFDYVTLPEMKSHFRITADVTLALSQEDQEDQTYTQQYNNEDFTFDGYYTKFSDIPSATINEVLKNATLTTITASTDEGTQLFRDNIDNVTVTIHIKATPDADAAPSQVDNLDKLHYGDGIYTDWVVRLRGGAKKITEVEEEKKSRRILVEDLSIAADNLLSNTSSSDWDFNDVVMDVKITINTDNQYEDKAEITLQALGGTLPIYLYYATASDTYSHTAELHEFFGQSSSTMINTSSSSMQPRIFTLTGNFSSLNSESARVADYNKVIVKVYHNGKLIELKAEKGTAPCKIATYSDFYWCRERIYILDPYYHFTNWVTNHSYTSTQEEIDADDPYAEAVAATWYASDLLRILDSHVIKSPITDTIEITEKLLLKAQ